MPKFCEICQKIGHICTKKLVKEVSQKGKEVWVPKQAAQALHNAKTADNVAPPVQTDKTVNTDVVSATTAKKENDVITDKNVITDVVRVTITQAVQADRPASAQQNKVTTKPTSSERLISLHMCLILLTEESTY